METIAILDQTPGGMFLPYRPCGIALCPRIALLMRSTCINVSDWSNGLNKRMKEKHLETQRTFHAFLTFRTERRSPFRLNSGVTISQVPMMEELSVLSTPTHY